jgi:hypothetical protein
MEILILGLILVSAMATVDIQRKPSPKRVRRGK